MNLIFPAFLAARNASNAPARPRMACTSSSFGDCVQLIKIKMVSPHSFEGLFQLCGRPGLAALGGFASQKNISAIGFQSWPQPLFGISIAWRNIKIVNTTLDGFADALGRLLGGSVHHNDSTKSQD